MPKRYVLRPGFVISRTDGDRHYIGVSQLLRLYGVRMSECHVYHPDRIRHYGDAIVLEPRYDGNYRLPQPTR